MKKAVSLFLVFIILLGMSFTVNAADVSVYINGEKIEFDVPAKIIDGRTMVPMRKIFESLGAFVTWDAPSQTATGKKDGVIVNLTIGSKTMFVNGEPKVLDVGPMLIDSRTLVPARAVAESFDCTVEWDGETSAVKIVTGSDFNNTKTKLSASEIAERVSPSVFYIEVYDSSARAVASGSGFFVTDDGVAVTNYHVIEETSSATITTINGDKFNVSGVIAYDEELDIAIIRVEKKDTSGKSVSSFPAVKLGDSDKIKAGQTIYALGSPVGLQNTISNGIISNVGQVVEGNTFIQITAAISSGSSGGALVDEYGEVLGITSAGIKDAENIGFAIPVNVLKLFTLDAEGMSYQEFEKADSAFTLEVNPESIEIGIGETKEVYVYANGKGDNWSIYWDTKNRYVVDCKWGDWLKDKSSVCPLIITGKREGTTVITVYSDVDFKGKTITVTVKGSNAPVYSGTKIPTYTSVTGVPVLSSESDRSTYTYIYNYANVKEVQKYVDYLVSTGYRFYKETEGSGYTAYQYISTSGSLISVTLAYRWNQVWVIIPK